MNKITIEYTTCKQCNHMIKNGVMNKMYYVCTNPETDIKGLKTSYDYPIIERYIKGYKPEINIPDWCPRLGE